MKTKTNRQLKHARLFVFIALLGLLLGTANVKAQNPEYFWWLFSVKGTDGTAILDRPVIDRTPPYADYIASSLTLPSQVTDGNFIYSVSETGDGLSAAQRKALTSVSIPNSITIISGSSFKNSSLQSVTIPSSVNTINNYAFANDSLLVSVTMPATVTSVQPHIFESCVSLQSAVILNNTIETAQFQYCRALKDVTISNNVTTIAATVFNGCSSLETLTVPASVTSFTNNSSSQATNSFGGMTGLKTLNFYAKNVPINNFNGTTIENLDLTGVETIPTSAFASCTKLKSLVLSNSLQTIGASAFQSDSSLLSVTIPSSVVTAMGIYTFQDCKSLQSATLLNNTIGVYQFYNCTSLKTVILSNNITSISAYAFGGCTALKDVTVYWATPLSVPASTFNGVNTQAATLHVPAGTKTLYQAALVWKDFFSIVDDAPTAIKTVDNSSFHACFFDNAIRIESPHAELISIYSITGKLLYSGKKNEGIIEIPFTPIQGVYIIKGSVSGTIKVIDN